MEYIEMTKPRKLFRCPWYNVYNVTNDNTTWKEFIADKSSGRQIYGAWHLGYIYEVIPSKIVLTEMWMVLACNLLISTALSSIPFTLLRLI